MAMVHEIHVVVLPHIAEHPAHVALINLAKITTTQMLIHAPPGMI